MADAPPHLCLLGDANSPHTRRWALEMRARGWRVSLVTARPEPLDGVEQRTLLPVRRSTDWLLRAGATRRHVRDLAPDIVHAHYLTSYGYLAARCGRHPLVMTAWGSDLLVTPHTHPWMRWLTGWMTSSPATRPAWSRLRGSTGRAPRCTRSTGAWTARASPPRPGSTRMDCTS